MVIQKYPAPNKGKLTMPASSQISPMEAEIRTHNVMGKDATFPKSLHKSLPLNYGNCHGVLFTPVFESLNWCL